MFTQKSLKMARIEHPKILCFFQTLSKQSFKNQGQIAERGTGN